MKILYFWCDKYKNLKNYNCNLAGKIEFSFDCELKKLIGISKNGDSKDFFDLLDEFKQLIPIEISAIAGINGSGKTTALQIICEILSNRGSVVSNDYKINYILIYEINNKKYITFEQGYVNEIIINGKKIWENNSEEYTIEILSLHDNKNNKEQNEGTLNFPELDSVATLFYANTYDVTSDSIVNGTNSINLSNHYLLNRFLKGDSELFKSVDFKDKKLEPLDFWQMEMLNWHIELMSSEIYEKLVEKINLVSPKYFNIILDYACDSKNIFNMDLKRFNDDSKKKFSFEEFIKNSMENLRGNDFFDYVNQRICDLTAELILSEKFINEDKIIKLINGFKDFNECSSIIELLNIIKINLKNNKCIDITDLKKDGGRAFEKQNEIIYGEVEKIISVAAQMIAKLEEIKKSCTFEEELIEIICQKNNFIEYDKVPILTKKINRVQSNKETFSFIRKLAVAQNEFYSKTKILPFYIEANGLSSGEKGYLSIFAKLFKFSKRIKDKKEIENIVILLDELDTFLHPEWKRKLVYLLTKFLKILFSKDKYKGIHIIMTTNEPYILSDIPKNNTILLSDVKENGEVVIRKYSQYKTLGANIIDLLDDAFFLSEGNKGSYITEVIKNISADLNKKEINKEKIRTYMEIAKLIEEPLIQKSLIQKLSSKVEKNDKEKMIDYYEQLIKNLKAEAEEQC